MAGLRGMVLNNLYLMRTRYTAFYLAMLVASLIGYLILREPMVLFVAQAFLLIVLPAAVLESAEISFVNKWNTFEKSWGLSPVLMVLSKYLLFIGVSLLCAGIWMISPFHGLYEMHDLIQIEYLLVLTQLMCIVYFPVMYLLNPGKKSASSIILVAAMFGAALLSFFVMPRYVLDNLPLTVAILVGLYIISVTLSVIFDKFHRGRAV